MLNKIYDWVDERLDITPLWRDIADHEVPEHVNPAHHFSAFVYCFGGLTFFITVIQILSGMFLTMYYVPDITNAWQSVFYLQNEVAFGQIVRGMHHWGASLVIVMMFLHTLRVFFQGAYKKPRELNWIVGVLIFFVMLGLGFTGYLLPWDMKALFATKVGLQIAESVPFIGTAIKTLLAGGSNDYRCANADTLFCDSRVFPASSASWFNGSSLPNDSQTGYFWPIVKNKFI